MINRDNGIHKEQNEMKRIQLKLQKQIDELHSEAKNIKHQTELASADFQRRMEQL